MPGIDDIAAPGATVLMMGNEAIARGALEAGVGFASCYPGTPATEILPAFADAAKRRGAYAEWSTNELTSIESAGAASLAGVRSMAIMKMNGTNTVCDFLATFVSRNLEFMNSGFVLISVDDPGPQNSPSDTDSRMAA